MAGNADEPTGRIKRVRRTSKKSGVQTIASTTEEDASVSTGTSRPGAGLFSVSGVRQRDITSFLRQLIMMLEAGTPLLRSLHTLAERGQGAGIRGLVGDICQFVESGNPLWQAFERHPRYFSPVFVNLVKASEASGTLVTVLRRLVDYRENRELLRKRVQAAMIYPVVLVVVCAAVITLITQVVVPQFEQMFSQMGIQLPYFSQLFIGTTHFIGRWWWLMVVIVVGLVVGYKFWVRNPLARLRADRFKLKIPIIGPILRNYAVSEFLRALSLLLRSGLSMMVTLDLVRSSVSNHAMGQTIQNVRDSVEQGEGMEAPLREAPDVVPPIVTDMLVTGEETGSLDEIAERLADTHEAEVDIAIAALGESLQPIITVIIGILVGLVAMALFIPMIGMIEKLNTGAGGV